MSLRVSKQQSGDLCFGVTEEMISVLGEQVVLTWEDGQFGMKGNLVCLPRGERTEGRTGHLQTSRYDDKVGYYRFSNYGGIEPFQMAPAEFVLGNTSMYFEMPPLDQRAPPLSRRIRSDKLNGMGVKHDRRITDRSPEEKVSLALKWLRESAHEVDGLKLLCRGDEIKAADLSARIEIVREL